MQHFMIMKAYFVEVKVYLMKIKIYFLDRRTCGSGQGMNAIISMDIFNYKMTKTEYYSLDDFPSSF